MFFRCLKNVNICQEKKKQQHFSQDGGTFLQVRAIQGGNHKVLNKLMGEVQKETKGRADPVRVRILLQELISS